jgi:hypothetical protein
MKARRFLLGLSLACAAGISLAALSALWAAAAAWGGLHGFLRNPLAMTTRVAPAGPALLEQVQRLERLETCRYNGQVIVRGDTGGVLPVWLAGDRILFVGRGEVVAGVDLQRLRPDDVRVQGSTLTLRLPPAEVLHTRLDNRHSEVFERRSGVLTGPDRHLEGRVRVEAEEQILQAAMESGMLRTARENAREALRRHLQPLGFSEVRIL